MWVKATPTIAYWDAEDVMIVTILPAVWVLERGIDELHAVTTSSA